MTVADCFFRLVLDMGSVYYAVVLIGRITVLARPSVSLSLRSVRLLTLDDKKCSKTKISVNVAHGRSNRNANVQLKKSQE